jgi:hypothetical protein
MQTNRLKGKLHLEALSDHIAMWRKATAYTKLANSSQSQLLGIDDFNFRNRHNEFPTPVRHVAHLLDDFAPQVPR